MKKTLALTLLACSTAFAQQITNTDGHIVQLQDCTRISGNVECTFLFRTTAKYDMHERFASYNLTVQAPNAQAFPVTQMQFSNGDWESSLVINVKVGMQASGKIRIPNFPGDTIKSLKFANYGTFTNIQIIQPNTAVMYPGEAKMRQQTRITDTFYTALLHGCFTVKDKASCLVTLLPDKPVARNTDNVAAYSGTLLQINNVPVVNGLAQVMVGTATFKDVSVR